MYVRFLSKLVCALFHILVFSKCFHAGFWAFSELKYIVKGVINSCNYGL